MQIILRFINKYLYIYIHVIDSFIVRFVDVVEKWLLQWIVSLKRSFQILLSCWILQVTLAIADKYSHENTA